MQQTIQLPQGPIEVRDTDPDGPRNPIFFIHGLLVDGRLWDGVVERLEDHHRCVIPDLPLGSHRTAMNPGADVSPRGVARIIASLLDEMKLEGVTIVANDTGGAIAQILVTEHPQRIGRLVLTPCDAFENFLPPMFKPLQWLAHVPGAVWLVMQSLRVKPLRYLPMAYGRVAKRRPPHALLDRWLAPGTRDAGVRRDIATLLKGIDSADTLAAAERLHDFSGPALLAWSPEERTFPFEHARRLAALLPDARITEIPDSWAFAPLDNPEAVAVAIASFLETQANEASNGAGSAPLGMEPATSG
jgi:pimeloyl-ACP methyl ester carboxylesterase